MNSHKMRFQLACSGVIALVVGWSALAQQATYRAPTPSDWAALAKLPDLSGVWERGGGGGGGQRANQNAAAPAGGRGAAAPPRGGAGGRGGPSFTPKYEALRAAAAKAPQPEDNE